MNATRHVVVMNFDVCLGFCVRCPREISLSEAETLAGLRKWFWSPVLSPRRTREEILKYSYQPRQKSFNVLKSKVGAAGAYKYFQITLCWLPAHSEINYSWIFLILASTIVSLCSNTLTNCLWKNAKPLSGRLWRLCGQISCFKH